MRTFRTVLEQKIWERRQTLEEFADYAERFAREHNEPGSIGVRHLQRLVAGRGPKGQPLGQVRATTARLLEHIFGLSIDELLSPPAAHWWADDSATELRQMLHASSRIDDSVVSLLHEQLMAIRRLDRQLGAVVAHEEVKAKINRVTKLFNYSFYGGAREDLAALLAEMHTLAGWEALDLGKPTDSWQHYEHAKTAALESGRPPLEAHTAAEQAFVMVDIGETQAAADLLAATRTKADHTCSRLLRAWLAAAHGETLAANNQRDESLRAFDTATTLLPTDSPKHDGPYIVLHSVHLARWRGHALARFADPEAVDVLANALRALDPTFVRAETALRVDLATSLVAIGEREEAQRQARWATRLATIIGSARQHRRLSAMRDNKTA